MHLQRMKKKFSLISLSFSVLVMGAILLQSFHSFHHLQNFLAEKHCHHKYATDKNEINHQHDDFDHCFVCEFALGTSTPIHFFSSDFRKIEVTTLYSFSYTKEITQSFRGALFALRAPPSFIV